MSPRFSYYGANLAGLPTSVSACRSGVLQVNADFQFQNLSKVGVQNFQNTFGQQYREIRRPKAFSPTITPNTQVYPCPYSSFLLFHTPPLRSRLNTRSNSATTPLVPTFLILAFHPASSMRIGKAPLRNHRSTETCDSQDVVTSKIWMYLQTTLSRNRKIPARTRNTFFTQQVRENETK